MKQSAGTLLYRRGDQGRWEVLLVHPSGTYNRGKPWSIPKGMPEPGESLEEAARRETCEETGLACGPLVPLGYITYTKSRKQVHGFAAQAEGEPRCASWEVDQCAYLSIDEARQRIHPEQRPLLDRLEAHLQGIP